MEICEIKHDVEILPPGKIRNTNFFPSGQNIQENTYLPALKSQMFLSPVLSILPAYSRQIGYSANLNI